LPLDEDTLVMLREYIERGGPVATNSKRFLFGLSRGQAWRITRECAREMGIPEEAITDDILGQVRKGVEWGLGTGVLGLR